MDEWLESLVPWGTEVIVWAQSFLTGWLEALARFFTSLGYEQFYLVVLPAVYWCVDKRTGVGLGFISLLSVWVNNAVKLLFSIPRPGDPRIRVLWPDTSPSFPSGHAQNAVVNWGYLAVRLRQPVLWAVAVVAVVCIGLSRILLGVHYPQDVIGGWLIGLALLAVYLAAERPVGRWLGRQPVVVQVLLAVAVPILLILLQPAGPGSTYPAETAVTSMGALAGFALGVIMERAWVRFRVEGPWWRRGLRFLLGMGVVLVLYAGPKLLLPAYLAYPLEPLVRFVRYALLGWAVAFLVPWLLVRHWLRLAEREVDVPGPL